MIQVWLSELAHMTPGGDTEEMQGRSGKFRALDDPPEQKALERCEGMASPATCLVQIALRRTLMERPRLSGIRRLHLVNLYTTLALSTD